METTKEGLYDSYYMPAVGLELIWSFDLSNEGFR